MNMKPMGSIDCQVLNRIDSCLEALCDFVHDESSETYQEAQILLKILRARPKDSAVLVEIQRGLVTGVASYGDLMDGAKLIIVDNDNPEAVWDYDEHEITNMGSTMFRKALKHYEPKSEYFEEVMKLDAT